MSNDARSADRDHRGNGRDKGPCVAISAEFLGSNDQERVKKCRPLAAEAAALAANAINPETQRSYLDQARQWRELANDMEQSEGAN